MNVVYEIADDTILIVDNSTESFTTTYYVTSNSDGTTNVIGLASDDRGTMFTPHINLEVSDNFLKGYFGRILEENPVQWISR